MNVIKSKIFQLHDKGVKPCLLIAGRNVIRELMQHNYFTTEPGVIIIGPCKLILVEWYHDDNFCEVYGNEIEPFFIRDSPFSVEIPINLQHRVTWFLRGLWKDFKYNLYQVQKHHSPKGMFNV